MKVSKQEFSLTLKLESQEEIDIITSLLGMLDAYDKTGYPEADTLEMHKQLLPYATKIYKTEEPINFVKE